MVEIVPTEQMDNVAASGGAVVRSWKSARMKNRRNYSVQLSGRALRRAQAKLMKGGNNNG